MRADPAKRLLASLRPAVRDDRVLEAMASVPREVFLPPELRPSAYENAALPIGGGQTISQPLVVARMCELLAVRPGDRVLDIGTGSGWHAAILARMGGAVVSIERDAALSAAAGRALRAARVEGIDLRVGDGFAGLPDDGPYDAINVAAATPLETLHDLEAHLANGGRLVAPVEDRRGGGEQRLVLTRRVDGRIVREWLEPVRFVPLTHGVVR